MLVLYLSSVAIQVDLFAAIVELKDVSNTLDGLQILVRLRVIVVNGTLLRRVTI